MAGNRIPERDYGYGFSPTVIGAPVIGEKLKLPNGDDAHCPNCGCLGVFEVKGVIEAPPQLRVGQGSEAVTMYVGCVACPWASPAIMTTRPVKQ